MRKCNGARGQGGGSAAGMGFDLIVDYDSWLMTDVVIVIDYTVDEWNIYLRMALVSYCD